jgi:glycosyltransferase involved in cell wall biosynthesis
MKRGMLKFQRTFSRKSASKSHRRSLVIPTARTVAAIVSVMNEEASIDRVLKQLHRIPFNELIVVINGSHDKTLQKVREHSSAVIVHYPKPLGHDVGRAIGAKLSRSDILLFLDGDFPVRAEKLLPFIKAINQGKDIALNNLTPFVPNTRFDSVTVMKRFLNLTMKKPELRSNSLTAVPHALSRAALDRIGCSELMVPPKAQVRAIQEGLHFSAPTSVNVISKNRRRRHNKGSSSRVAKLIIGDHIEALRLAMEQKGERLGFHDTFRKREYVRWRS